MKNQFFYTLEIPEETKKEGSTEIKVSNRVASFNIELVNRAVEYEPNKLMLMLMDYHNEAQVVRTPLFDKVGNLTGAFKTEYKEITVHSEIYLNEEDTTRYRKLVEIAF